MFVLILVAFVIGGVAGWYLCGSLAEDKLPLILLKHEQNEFDKTMKIIESEPGQDFQRNFGMRGTVYKRPLGREKSDPSVVIMLDDFLNIISIDHFSYIDNEELNEYLAENDLPEDDMEEALEHYGSSILEKYETERKVAFDKLMGEVNSA